MICEKHCCNFIVTFRFGKKRLEVMASTLASEDYVKSHARQCPHCNAPIEKNDGCNKVTLCLYYMRKFELCLSDHVLAMRH